MQGADNHRRDADSKPAPRGGARPDDVRDPSEPKLRLDAPTISLPKGGGALKGIDETYTVNPASGTASIALPLPLTPARGGALPPVRLRYDSGSGNSVVGLGWSLDLPTIRRRTDKQLPRYRDEDVFLFRDAEELVPASTWNGATWSDDAFASGAYAIARYRPRIEGDFARIEKITHATLGTWWRVCSLDNVTTFFGLDDTSRIFDPLAPANVYEWLPALSFDDQGNCVVYDYKPEDLVSVPSTRAEANRRSGVAPFTNLHLKKIRYGNRLPYAVDETSPYRPAPAAGAFLFHAVFDYGEHDPLHPTPDGSAGPAWGARADPFSSYRSGFEIRTYRLLQRVLMFHQFDELAGGAPCLVRSLDLEHVSSAAGSPQASEVTYLRAASQCGYTPTAHGGYARKALPPMEFEYEPLHWHTAIATVDRESSANLPAGAAGGYQLMDLYGEGIPGVFSEQAGAWFYKANLGDVDEDGRVRFDANRWVVPKPSFAGMGSGVLELRDLDGTGLEQVVVHTPELQGYFDRGMHGEWLPFRPFERTVRIDLDDRNLRRLDLDGDGRADLLISEENAFVWYRSEKHGYEPRQRAPKPHDEERGPAIVFAEAQQTIFLADMTGDGLLDIVRIRNRDVSYWPNLGYGRFGAKVAMENAPRFAPPDLFDTRYLHLADVSGTGASDLLYLGPHACNAYLNLSGNAWSEAQPIAPFFATESPNQIATTDLLGNGTACIVWSSTLPANADAPMRYLDLMGGKKAHLLRRYVNNFGKEVAFSYKSSTWYYLKDKLEGRPWVTRLPFPIHCLRQIEVRDRISGARLVSELRYRHGYYDRVEREFRGFGMVEQRDAESFDHWEKAGAGRVLDRSLLQAPVLTRTWFHTGAPTDRDDILTAPDKHADQLDGNRYAYLKNNPLIHRDSNGMSEEPTHGILTYRLAFAAGFPQADAARLAIATAAMVHDRDTSPVSLMDVLTLQGLSRVGQTEEFHFPNDPFRSSLGNIRDDIAAQARGERRADDLERFGRHLHTLEDLGFVDAPGPHMRHDPGRPVQRILAPTLGMVGLALSSGMLVASIHLFESNLGRGEKAVLGVLIFAAMGYGIYVLAFAIRADNIGHPSYRTERGDESTSLSHAADQAPQDPQANTEVMRRVYAELELYAPARYGPGTRSDDAAGDAAAEAAIAEAVRADTSCLISNFANARPLDVNGVPVAAYSEILRTRSMDPPANRRDAAFGQLAVPRHARQDGNLPLAAGGEETVMRDYTIRGQVISETGLRPLPDLRVEAWDYDHRIDKCLGAGTTDADGTFVIVVHEAHREELLERLPDIYFKVFRDEQTLANTRTQVLWSFRDPHVKAIIPVRGGGHGGNGGNRENGGNGQTPPQPSSVEGVVTTEDGRAVPDLRIEVWDQRLGEDALIATCATDPKGHYVVHYKPSELGDKRAADLWVRALDPQRQRAELARSEVIYQAGPAVVVNLTVAADQVSRPSEYARLLAAVEPVLAGVMFRDLDPKGVAFVANQVRWDARPVAMAAQAARLTQETKIPAEHYYALLRAGVPSDRAALHRLPDASVEHTLKQAMASGVIGDGHPIDATIAIHRKESGTALRQFTPPSAVSSLGDMLALSLDQGKSAKFLEAYHATADQPAALWSDLAQRGFDAILIARLQTDGKLGYLTRQNAPLVARLRERARVTTADDLVSAGLYKASAWQPLVGSDVPPQITADAYAAGLAAQVNLSYPTLVAAEMVRRGEIPVDAPRAAGDGEVAAFLRAGHGKYAIGVDPVKRWAGFSRLGAQGRDGARLVERLHQLSPSNESMIALHREGLNSAFQIASQPKEHFLSKHGRAFPDQTEAELVYRKAQEIHTTVLNMTAMYLAYRGSPNVYAMTGRTTKSAPDFSNVPGTPTLEDLLSDMDYCACDQCKSVLGAAAYFVELLQFIDVAHVPAGKRNPIDVLFERRPDLQHLLLSCENTNVALPYIDIVNEILEFFVVNGSLATFAGYSMREDSATADLLADPEYVKDAAYVTTKDAVYPHPLPFDMPLAALRLLVRAWDTTLADALGIFGTPADARREVLALNAPEFDILTNTGFRTLPQHFGLPAAATIAEVNDAVAEGKTFCRTVDISYEDLVGILRTRFINPGAPLVPLLQQLAITLAQLQSWYTGVIDDGALRALLPATIDPAQYGGDVLRWLRNNRTLIMGLITLTDMSAGAEECSFATVELRFALPDSAANRLDALAYWKLLRFIRLWKKLGWSLELTDTLVTTFLGMAPELLTTGNLDATFRSLIARVANFSALLTRQAVSSKKIADWLAIWDTAVTVDVGRERLARLIRIGATDLAHFMEITGVDPLAGDMAADAPSILRFLDEWKALKSTGLKMIDVNYLLRNRDDGDLIAPTEAGVLRDLKALRDALTAIEADIGTPPDNVDLAYARSKLALVYDASVVDHFVGLISGGTTYRASLPTTEEALPAKLSAVDAHLGFDPFEKALTHTGILSAATAAVIGGAADTLVLADMSVITVQSDLDGYIAALKTAAQALVDSGLDDLQQLNVDYAELKLAYDAAAAITDPTAQAKALVDQILPTLRNRVKTIALRATLASQLKTDTPLVDVLTENATIVHATGDVTAGVLQDFRDLEKLAPLAADGVYALHLDPPSTDDYMVYVAAPAGTTVTLTIGGSAAIPATAVGPRGEVQSAVALPLTSGVLVSVVLTLAELPVARTAELRWRTKGMAKTSIPASRVYANDRVAHARASLLRLQKAAALLRAVALTPRELRHLASVNADTRSFLDSLDTDGSISAADLHTQWARISWLAWFGKLKASEPDPDTWVGLLEQPGRLTPQGRLVLAAAAEWTDQDLTDVLTRFGLALTDLTPLHVFRRVKEAVDFVVATQRTAAELIAWTTASPNAALIATIKAALRAQQNALAWRTTLQSVNDPLRNARRDALVAYILHHARPAPAVDTADKLYEHFLIDCEMDACMATSRIRLALSTVQLFVMRCLMNLEHDVEASSIRADQWEWMKRYRVWEANRKIFLYPENWLAPELRDNKSPFFRELESELLKSDITDELAEDAYLAYLKKLDEVAYLEILGSYLQEGEAGNQDDDILHVFGRTNGNTHQYYYRRYEYGYWTPWEKMTLSIEGDLLFPVIWKSQLFVFWLSPVHKPDGADSTQRPVDMGNQHWGGSAKVTAELNICWGEYYKGKWTSPKSSELKEPLRLTGMDKFEPQKVFVAARKEKPSPDVSERLVMMVGYIGTPLKFFSVTFTSKNAPPRIELGADFTLLKDIAIFEYILFWHPQTNALLDSNALRGQGKTFKVTITQPSGASSAQLDETVLTKVGPLADGFRLRTLMHPVENQWEAPVIYNDEHSIFFVSPDERVELVSKYTGYFWNDSAALMTPPASIRIPPLYERPVRPDPIGPISNPLVDLIHPNYDRAISDNNQFVFGGTAFDARGIATKGAMP